MHMVPVIVIFEMISMNEFNMSHLKKVNGRPV